jgi:biopolymer transport protein ExbD
MRLLNEPDIPPQINIVPMIDVIFAILTFFIMSTLFLTRTEGLPVNLPQAATSKTESPAKTAKVTVTIDAGGGLSLNKESIQLDNLEAALNQKIEQNQDLVVVLNADKAVNHGQVVEVMDQVRRVKGAKLAIATQRK